MSKLRFRFAKDMDVNAPDEEAGLEILKDICVEQGSVVLSEALNAGAFSCLGEADVVDISERDTERLSDIIQRPAGIVLMSCKYRGENFIAICKKNNIEGDLVGFKPMALLLNNSKSAYLTDPAGEPPFESREEGIRVLKGPDE